MDRRFESRKQPSLYQSGRWELFMTMAQPGRAMRTVNEEMSREHGDDIAKRAVFNTLVEMIETAADEWIQKLDGMP